MSTESIPSDLDKPVPARRKFHWTIFLWLLAPLILWWMLRNISFGEIWDTLRELSATQLIILAALNVMILLLISGRWWLIVRAQGHRVPYLVLSGYRLISFGISYLTPGPQVGGESAQVYLIQNRHRIPTPAVVASVTLDKILEMMANFAFVMLGILIAMETGLFADLASGPTLAVIVTLFILLAGYTLALWAGKAPLSWLLRPFIGRHALMRSGHHSVASAEEQISRFCREQPLAVFNASALSLLIWLVMLFEYWLTLHFLGVHLSPFQAIGAMTAARIAFLFPLPGGLGVLEASQVMAMQALGFSAAYGISISLVMRARDLSLGGLGLLLGGVISRQTAAVSLPSRSNSPDRGSLPLKVEEP